MSEDKFVFDLDDDDIYNMEPDKAIELLEKLFDVKHRKEGESIRSCASRKIREIYHEERRKEKGKRRGRSQIIAMAFSMCKK